MDNGKNEMPESTDVLDHIVESLSSNGNIVLEKSDKIEDVFQRLDHTYTVDQFENKLDRIFATELDYEDAESLRTAFLTAFYSVQTGGLEAIKNSNVDEELINFIIDAANKYEADHLKLMQRNSVGDDVWLNTEIDIRINDDDVILFDYIFTRIDGEKIRVSNTYNTNLNLVNYILSRQRSSFSYLNERTISDIDPEDINMLRKQVKGFLEDLNNLEDELSSNEQ